MYKRALTFRFRYKLALYRLWSWLILEVQPYSKFGATCLHIAKSNIIRNHPEILGWVLFSLMCRAKTIQTARWFFFAKSNGMPVMRDGDMKRPNHSKFLPCLSPKDNSVHWHVLDEDIKLQNRTFPMYEPYTWHTFLAHKFKQPEHFYFHHSLLVGY